MDSVFEQVVKSLYGDGVDPRELWKGMPDQSAVHVRGNQKSKKEKKIAAVGLGATGVAGVGGVHALYGTKALHTAQKEKLKAGKWKPGPVLSRFPEAIHSKPAAAIALGTAGWTALHATELAGDALGARAQVRELKKKPQKTVSKAKFPFKVVRAGKQGLSDVERASLNRTAKRSQKVLVGGSIAAAGAGGYLGMKRYGLKMANPVQPVSPPPKSRLTKVADLEDNFTWEGEISKVDTDKRLAFGFCSLSKINGKTVVDLQGDIIPIEETEKSAYKYVVDSRKGGRMHQRMSKEAGLDAGPVHVSDLVESVVITPEKLKRWGLSEDSMPHGWWVGYRVNDDETWKQVKDGSLTGFSIHGRGIRKEAIIND